METQTSVTSTSAPFTALTGSVSNVRTAPVSFATARHVSISALSGKYASGAAAVKCIPIFAQPTISESPML